MTGSSESASSSNSARILVCGVNWVGDSILSMPAIQAYAAAHPGHAVTLLVKPSVAPLWAMHRAVSEVLELEPGAAGAWRTAARIRARAMTSAFVLPHSFRSALVPFLARVPDRAGLPGHSRDAMLHRVVTPRSSGDFVHQAWEYMDLMMPGFSGPLPPPRLSPPPTADAEAAKWLDGDGPWIGLIPGAARGPSKQWPAAHFRALGEMLKTRARIAVIGAPGEEALCASVADPLGPAAVPLAGRLSFATWAAVLKRCRAVVANDSGGMHLSAALGTPVVALFGQTDPARTGPLGPARILQNSRRRSRDIARDSAAARISLASIPPEDVYEALRTLSPSALPSDHA